MMLKYDLDIRMLSVCLSKQTHLMRHFKGFKKISQTQFDLSREFVHSSVSHVARNLLKSASTATEHTIDLTSASCFSPTFLFS